MLRVFVLVLMPSMRIYPLLRLNVLMIEFTFHDILQLLCALA